MISSKNVTLINQQQKMAQVICKDAIPEVDFLKPTPQGESARLAIYKIAYRSRLGEALKENYPVLARVLGDDAFIDLANAFLDHCPSRTPSIRWFGAALAEFTNTDDVLPHPSLTDLIRMEWALNTAFDAADAEPVSVGDLMQIPPEVWPSLCFGVHPSLRLLTLNWNVAPLWSAISADENAEPEPPEPLAHQLLIWRAIHTTQYRSIEQAEAQLLSALIDGQNFGTLCELASQTDQDNAAQTVAGYLRVWIEAGLLIAVSGRPDNKGST